MKMKLLNKIRFIFFNIFPLIFKVLSFKNKILLRLVLIVGISVGIGTFIFLHFSVRPSSKPKWEVCLERADRLYQAGRLNEAKKVYFEVKEKFPSNPEEDWINFQLANIFKSSGFFHRAAFFYEKLTGKDSSPYFFQAEYNLVHCYMKTEDEDKALEVAREIIKKFPESEKLPEMYLCVANCLLKKSEEREAISIYQKIIKEYPRTDSASIAYLKLGDIFFSKNRYSDAIIFYSSLVRNYPESKTREEALFKLVHCYSLQGKVNEAVSVLFVLLRDFPRSKFFARGLFFCGEVFLRKGEFEKAREVYEKIESLCPADSSFLVEVKKKLAEIYINEKKYKEAISIYEEIIKNHPWIKDTSEIYLTLGSLYLTTGEYSRAIIIFQKFIHYFPLSSNLFSVYFNLGRAFFKEGLYLKAIEAFKKALRCSPSGKEKSSVLSQMTGAYEKIGLWNEAIKSLRDRLSLSKRDKKVTVQIKIALIKCYINKGEISSAKKMIPSLLKDISRDETQKLLHIADYLWDAGEKEIACSIYDKVSKVISQKDKEFFYAMAKIAYFQKSKGEVNKAIGIYQKLLKLAKNDSPEYPTLRKKVLMNLADLYYSIGGYKKACKFYLEAIKNYPQSREFTWFLYQAGNCYRHLGSSEEAKRFYAILREKFPQDLWTKLSLVML